MFWLPHSFLRYFSNSIDGSDDRVLHHLRIVSRPPYRIVYRSARSWRCRSGRSIVSHPLPRNSASLQRIFIYCSFHVAHQMLERQLLDLDLQ